MIAAGPMLADAAAVIHEDFGFDALYLAPGAAAVPCRVVEERNVEQIGDMGQVIERRTALSFLASEVPVPERGAIVEEVAPGTRRWTIDRVADDDGYVVQALVTR